MTENTVACPACNCHEHQLLGQLGDLEHLRCRACGLVHHVDATEDDD